MTDNNNLLSVNNYAHDAFAAYRVGNLTRFLYRNSDDLGNHGAIDKSYSECQRITPQTGVANVFNNNQAQVDFIMPIGGGKLDKCDNFVLELSLTNTDGVNIATLLPAQFMIDNYQELISGNTFNTFYSHQLLIETLFLCYDDECIYNYSTLGGFTGGINGVPYSENLTIPAGGTARLYLRITPMIAREKLFLKNCLSQITYRFYFESTGLTTTSLSTPGSLRLNALNMFVGGVKYDESIKNKLLSRYKSFDHITNYWQGQRAVISGQGISDITDSFVNVTEFSDLNINFSACMFVPNGAIKENLYNFVPIENLSLQVNGQTISSFEQTNTNWIRFLMMEFFPGVTSTVSNNIYIINHSHNPQGSAITGMSSGSYKWSPNCRLQVRAATGSAGTYDVYIIAFAQNNIIQRTDGTMERIIV